MATDDNDKVVPFPITTASTLRHPTAAYTSNPALSRALTLSAIFSPALSILRMHIVLTLPRDAPGQLTVAKEMLESPADFSAALDVETVRDLLAEVDGIDPFNVEAPERFVLDGILLDAAVHDPAALRRHTFMSHSPEPGEPDHSFFWVLLSAVLEHCPDEPTRHAAREM